MVTTYSQSIYGNFHDNHLESIATYSGHNMLYNGRTYFRFLINMFCTIFLAYLSHIN